MWSPFLCNRKSLFVIIFSVYSTDNVQKGQDNMKLLRKMMISIVASVLMFTGVCSSVEAKAINGHGGSPVRYEGETDGLPDYTEGYEMHGFSDEDAEEIDSMFSDEVWAKFNEDMDDLLGFEPVSDHEVAAVFGKVEKFRASGGVGAYLENNNLLMGAEIGLTANRLDKVKVLGVEENASSWIYVVDKDATCVVVQDEDGMGIPYAQVTISYVNDKDERVTQSIITSDGQRPGIATFAGLPEEFNCILDIQADGYHAISVLDKFLTGGDTFIFSLTEATDDELYIRGIDLEGKDLLSEETDLSLVDMDTEDLSLKVLVSRIGDETLPDSIELYSDTRGKTILKVDGSSGYEYDSQTRVYTADKRWAEQNAGLLADGDVVSVRFGSETFRISHLTVKDARETPRLGETTLPLTAEKNDAKITDRMGGAGWLNFTVQAFQVPVTFGVFPDGTFIFMASYDITNLDKNTQYKYQSLFDKSWKPKAFSNAKNILETFQKSFWQNAQKVNSGKTKLNSKDKVWALTNKTYDIGMSFSVYLALRYSEETDDYYGNGGFVFTLNFMGGLTEYFVFFAGPVAIPLYIGFELSAGIKVGISVNAFTDEPPYSERYDKKWKYTSNGGWDLQSRIDALANLDIFVGVGIKGVLGANATGYITGVMSAVLGKGPANIFTADPHTFGDLFWGMVINYYLLFFSGQIKLDCLNSAKRIYDNWGEEDELTAEDFQIEFKDLSLESCADELIPLNNGGDTDEVFTIANNDVLLSGGNLKNVDAYTYPDNQAQFVAANNYTALFRILADGDRTHLVYQYQNPDTGEILPEVYKVRLPEDMSVTEYVAVPNKYQAVDQNFSNYVYIGAVLADNTEKDMAKRAKTSEVAAIIVDLRQAKTVSSEIASDPADSGKFLYSAPRPSGLYQICDVGYAATRIEECETAEQLLKTIADGLRDIDLTYTKNVISYRTINGDGERHYNTIDSGSLYSTGAAIPHEPTYWVIDKIKSTDKTLVLKGYEADATCTEDRMHYAQVDITDVKLADFNYETVLTNWQYVNNRNYFIAGDTVYWMYKDSTDPTNYSWVVEPVKNGVGMINTEGRYLMITNNNQSAIYIIGVIDSYDIDVEEWTETKSSNKLMLHTLITDNYKEEITCELHGPIGLTFAKGDKLTNFTVAYNPDRCDSKGLSIVYSSPIEADRKVYSPISKTAAETEEVKPVEETQANEDAVTDIQPAVSETEEAALTRALPVEAVSEETVTDAPVMLLAAGEPEEAVLAEANDDDDDDYAPEYGEADEAAALRLWSQDAERGMRVTDVQIPDYIFRNNEPYVVTNVTYRNYGYAIEGPVMFTAHDEQGNKLTLTDGYRDYADDEYIYAQKLYTGDTATAQILVRPHASWKPNTEHEITLEVVPELYYNGDLDDIVNVAAMKADNMTMTANNILIGDKHYVSFNITNNTFVGEKIPKIHAMFNYADPEKQLERTYSMPGSELLTKYDGEDEIPVDQIYNFELDMDQVWKDGLKEGLLGIYFMLVDEDGDRQSNEVVYLVNPEEVMKDLISGTKLDENGEPLEGATIGLFGEDGEEPLQTAVSDEEGRFIFSNLDEGSYIVRETEAPEGYALNETEYPVTCEGTGEIIEIEITNKLISGNVQVKLTGPDDKPLAKAEFEIFSGDEKVGRLTEKADGTYEFTGLPYGEYTIKAKKMPDGYKLTDTYTVKITEDGATVVVNIRALRSDADSPETGDGNALMFYAAMNMLSVMAIIEIIRRRKAVRAH